MRKIREVMVVAKDGSKKVTRLNPYYWPIKSLPSKKNVEVTENNQNSNDSKLNTNENELKTVVRL